MSHTTWIPRGFLLRGTAALAATFCTAILFSGASVGFRSAPFAFEGDAWTRFGEGIRVSERHAGMVLGGLETPLSVVIGDVDGDGIVDLVAGYGTADGGVVAVHRGLGPDAPHFRRRAVRTEVSHRPEHLVVGDFDGDGRPDLALADRESAVLARWKGLGSGRFVDAGSRELDGPVSALLSADIDRPDGLPDLVAGVKTQTGGQVVFFSGPKGAFGAAAEVVHVTGPPAALVADRLDAHWPTDVAVAVGSEIVLLSGRDHGVAEPGTRERRVTRRLGLSAPVKALAAGDFVGSEAKDLAVGLADGTVEVLDLEAKEAYATPFVFPESGGRLVKTWTSSGSRDDLAVVDGLRGEVRLLHTRHFDELVPRSEIAGMESQVAVETSLRPVRLGFGAPVAGFVPRRLNHDGLDDLVVLLGPGSGSGAALVVAPTAPLLSIVVDSEGDEPDENPNDGLCRTSAGTCTLRAAMDLANRTEGPHEVTFTVSRVQALNFLPGFSGTVNVDGTSRGMVVISPDNGLYSSIRMYGAKSSMRGMAVGDLLFGGGKATVQGNHIGVDLAGTALLWGNGLQAMGSENLVGGTTARERNIVTRVRMSDGSGNVVTGNYVGLDRAGRKGVGFRGDGILMAGGPGNRIGGLEAGEGNVIAGLAESQAKAVFVSPTALGGILIQGNLIGLGADGTTLIGNRGGIYLQSQGATVTVGGTTRRAGNVIVGCGQGIGVGTVDSVYIHGNIVGTTPDGRSGYGNYSDGINVGGLWALIGGPDPVHGNVIAANQFNGISVGAAGPVTIQNNLIGVGPGGQGILGNGTNGIRLAMPLTGGTLVGGMNAGNVVAHSGESGIRISSTDNVIYGNHIFGNQMYGIILRNTGGSSPQPVRNRLSQNAIYDNGGLGISFDGRTNPRANDPGDVDEGPNSGQNYPELSLLPDGRLRAALSSVPNTQFDIEFFGNSSCDPSGHGEGKRHLATVTVATDAAGSAIVEQSPAVSADEAVITATATDPDGNTSEFSNCIRIEPVTPVLVVQVMEDSVSHQARPIPFTRFEVATIDLANSQDPIRVLDTLQTDADGLLHLSSTTFAASGPFYLRATVRDVVSPKRNRFFVDDLAYRATVDNLVVDRAGTIAASRLEPGESDTTRTYMMRTAIGFHLMVGIEWKAEVAYVENVKESLRQSSRLLFDVTNGHGYLRQVVLFDDKEYWDDVDLRHFASNTVWPRAHLDGLAARNRYITMPPRMFGSKQGNVDGAYTENPLQPSAFKHYATLVHEMGHFILGLYDEYINDSDEKIYPNLANTQPYINFSLMDNQFRETEAAASELSAWRTTEWEQTKQNARHAMTAWDYVRRKYQDLTGPVRADLHTPAMKGLSRPDVVSGPEMTSAFDVGAQMTLIDLTRTTNQAPVAFRTLNPATREPLGGALISVLKPRGRWLDLGKSVIKQGPDRGNIRLIGAESGDRVYMHVTEAARQTGEYWALAVNFSEPAGKHTGDPIELEMRVVQTETRQLSAVVPGLGTSLRWQTWAAPVYAAVPDLRIIEEGLDPVLADVRAVAGGYEADLPRDVLTGALLLQEAKDDTGADFFVPQRLAIAEIDSTNLWLLPAHQDMELFVEPAEALPRDVIVLGSDFPEPTAGLPDSVARVSPVFSLQTRPVGLAWKGRLLIYFDADSLLAAVPEAVVIHQWQGDRWVALPTTASIDTLRQTASAEIDEPGFYAAYLDMTRTTGVGVESDRAGRKLGSLTEPNYPNPFMQTTRLPFVLGTTERVEVRLFNVLGREVLRIEDRLYPPGRHEIAIDAEGLPSGVYLCRIQIGARQETRRMMLLR